GGGDPGAAKQSFRDTRPLPQDAPASRIIRGWLGPWVCPIAGKPTPPQPSAWLMMWREHRCTLRVGLPAMDCEAVPIPGIAQPYLAPRRWQKAAYFPTPATLLSDLLAIYPHDTRSAIARRPDER